MAGLRIVFIGTAELSCASLQSLFESPAFNLLAVVTQPDRPKGRQLKLQPSPVKSLAAKVSLPVLQPERARDEEFIKQLRSLEPDLIAVAAYGQILPANILELPRFGCLNVHTSLLPRYRGAAPIQWAILDGAQETGVTIMKMDIGLDTGDILTQQKTTILDTDDAQTLHDRLARMGAELLVQTIPRYIDGEIKPHPQPATGVSYARKIKKEDGHIDWSKPALAIWNQVRGLVPWPGAFTFLQTGGQPQLLKLWQAEIADLKGPPGEILEVEKNGIVVGCGSGALRIRVLQREGSRRLTAQEFLTGYPVQRGERLK
jgi:methionyl-tRNA formyltransferase